MSTYICGICFDKFNDDTSHPNVFLDCGHLICEKCKDKLINIEIETSQREQPPRRPNHRYVIYFKVLKY